MHTVIALALLTASLAAALPTQSLTNFFLVTSTSRDPVSNSSTLPDVNATSLFDGDSVSSELYQLRLIAPGYNSLPQFDLIDNALHTIAYGPVGNGEYDYVSTEVKAGGDLAFSPTPDGTSNLSLKDGYLLAVDGQCTGWTVCSGAHSQAVISWKGTDTSCEARFIHAVRTAPY